MRRSNPRSLCSRTQVRQAKRRRRRCGEASRQRLKFTLLLALRLPVSSTSRSSRSASPRTPQPEHSSRRSRPSGSSTPAARRKRGVRLWVRLPGGVWVLLGPKRLAGEGYRWDCAHPPAPLPVTLTPAPCRRVRWLGAVLRPESDPGPDRFRALRVVRRRGGRVPPSLAHRSQRAQVAAGWPGV